MTPNAGELILSEEIQCLKNHLCENAYSTPPDPQMMDWCMNEWMDR